MTVILTFHVIHNSEAKDPEKHLEKCINNLKEENIDILIVICGSCDITSLDLVSNNKIIKHKISVMN